MPKISKLFINFFPQICFFKIIFNFFIPEAGLSGQIFKANRPVYITFCFFPMLVRCSPVGIPANHCQNRKMHHVDRRQDNISTGH